LPPGGFGDVTLSPDCRQVAYTLLGDRHRDLYLWELGHGAQPRRLTNDVPLGVDISLVEGLTFSPGGSRWLAMSQCRNGRVWRWDTLGGKELPTLNIGDGELASPSKIALSPDGRWLASVNRSGTMHDWGVRLWDLTTGTQVRRLSAAGGSPHVAFFPAAARLLLLGERSRQVYDFDTGEITVLPGSNMPRWLPGSRLSPWPVAFSADGGLVAIGDGGRVCVLEVATWREVRSFHAERCGEISSLALSSDACTLASGVGSGEIFLWDLTGRRSGPGSPLSADQLSQFWDRLADPDPAVAYPALWGLAKYPEPAVPFLRDRLHLAVTGAERRCARLVRQLDDVEYRVRERATVELTELAPEVGPALRAAVAGGLSPEARTRIESVLTARRGELPLQYLRAIQALEYAAEPTAAQAVDELADGWSGNWVTQAAKAARVRLRR
jgi:hypothetical protein